MSFPTSHPAWMWLYFGLLGSAGLILFSLIGWSWMKLHARLSAQFRPALRWGMLGCMFLFFATWFACGIGGPPGNLLSADLSVRNPSPALGAGLLSMLFTVPGWGCLLIGLRKAQAAVFRQTSP